MIVKIQKKSPKPKINTQMVKNKIFALVDKSLAVLYAIFYALFVIRALPQSEYGILVLAIMILTIAKMLTSDWNQYSMMHFFASAKTTNERAEIITATVIWKISLTFMITLLLMLSASYFDMIFKVEHLSSLIFLIPWLLVSYFFHDFYISLFQGAQLIGSIALMNGSRICVNTALLLIMNQKDQLTTASAVLLANFIACMFASIVGLLLGKESFIYTRRIHWGWMKKSVEYGKYIFGINVGVTAYTQVDIILLGIMMNPVNVAIYSVARRFAEFLREIGVALAMVVAPQAAELSTRPDGGIQLRKLNPAIGPGR